MTRSVFRKPSLKKSLSAKYKGAYKRKIKKALIPGYGTRTAGWLHPKRKLYNKMYYRTSVDTRKLITGNAKAPKSANYKATSKRLQSQNPETVKLAKEFARIDIDLIPNSETAAKHQKLAKYDYYMIQTHRACHYIWKIALLLCFLSMFTGWEWLYMSFFYIWGIAVILRYALPMVINTIDAIFFRG